MSMKKTFLLRCVAVVCLLATLLSPVSALAAPAPAEDALTLTEPAETLPETDGSAAAAEDTAAEDIPAEEAPAEETPAAEDTAAEETPAAEDTAAENTTANGTPLDPDAGEWVESGGKYYYYGTDGEAHKGWLELDGNRYYLDPETGAAWIGWQTIDDEKYYFGYTSHYALTGLWKLSGYYYFFNEDTGAMEHSGLFTAKDGKMYYLNENGTSFYGWKTIDDEKYYFGYTSRYALSGLQSLGGYYYFFNEDTCAMEHSGLFTAKDGKMYYLNENGTSFYGWKTIDDDKYYFGYSSRCALTGLQTLSGYKYLFDDEGVMQTGWQTVNGSLYFFSLSTGRAQSGWVTDETGNTYYLGYSTKKVLTGWQTISGYKYYFDEDGVMQTGWLLDDGDTYYLNPSTGRATGGWAVIDGEEYYFGSTSKKMLIGLNQIGNYYYSFNEDATSETYGAMEKGWKTINSDLYYFSTSTGRALTGWYTDEEGNEYYFSTSTNIAMTGLRTVGDYKYYFDEETSIMQTGWHTINGSVYYFHPSTGRAASGWTVIDGKQYYFGSSSKKMLTGMQTISGYKYYFNEDGVMQTGWQHIDGELYYFSSAGRAQYGWYTDNAGNKYYMGYSSRCALKGLWKLSGYYYFFDETTGIMQHSGWHEAEDGSRYYLNENGTTKSGWFTDTDGEQYYFGSSTRKALTGVWTISGSMYYFHDTTGALQTESGICTGVNGDKYWISESGKVLTGWYTDDSGDRFYFSSTTGKMLTGLNKISGSFYYFNDNTAEYGEPLGRMMSDGWFTTADGVQCFLYETGKARLGWLEDEEGNRYFLSSTLGGLATGLWKVDSSYYFFDETTGAMQKDGLVTAQDGSLYYLNASGISQYGWKTIGENTYYFGYSSRKALSGLQSISSSYYFFDETTCVLQKGGVITALDGSVYYANASGVLRTGWQTIDGNKYYFGAASKYALTGLWKLSGYYYFFDEETAILCHSGWHVAQDGSRYYLDENGRAASGWQTIDGNKYYFGASSHTALTGLWKLSGSYYYFDEDGIMLTSQWVEADGNTYRLSATGKALGGWTTKDGEEFYFCPIAKNMLTGWQTIDGECYYFYTATDGYGHTPGSRAYDATIDGYYINSTGTITLGTKSGMTLTAQSYSSPTKYLIVVDTTNNRVGVFTGSYQDWSMLYYWSCSTGKYSTPTPTGTFSVYGLRYSGFGEPKEKDNYWCRWATAFYNTGELTYHLHSILYYYDNVSLKDARLGYNISNGCVRLSVNNAYWLYCNIPDNTTVVCY